jgi:Holliday junction DNA helicase RuvA
MIARLKGILIERAADGCVVDCGGVGYDVTVSLATLTQLPEAGVEVTLRVYTHATENRVALFGFATQEERELFDRLITVKNVGPSTAIGILSGATSAHELAKVIAAGDVVGLTRLRGVGKKTAELLVVELREKCELLLASWGAHGGVQPATIPAAPARKPNGNRNPLLDDVTLALVGLGWRQAEVDKVVSRMEVPDGATIEALLRDALRAMPRS